MFVSEKSMAHLPVSNFEQSQLFSIAIPEEKAVGGVGVYFCLFVCFFKTKALSSKGNNFHAFNSAEGK